MAGVRVDVSREVLWYAEALELIHGLRAEGREAGFADGLPAADSIVAAHGDEDRAARRGQGQELRVGHTLLVQLVDALGAELLSARRHEVHGGQGCSRHALVEGCQVHAHDSAQRVAGDADAGGVDLGACREVVDAAHQVPDHGPQDRSAEALSLL